jgi:type I restriction enzyme S subunit
VSVELLLGNFKRVTEAPEGVERLRRFVLDLAVRGLLVEQDAADKPAQQMLDRIHVDRATVKGGTGLERTRHTSQDAPRGMPFRVPPTWEWVTLGQLGRTQTGTTPSKNEDWHSDTEIPFIKPGDLYPDRVDYANAVLSETLAQKSGRIAYAGSLLMVCIGTIGKCQLIDRACTFNQQISSLSPYECVRSDYLLAGCRSEYFQKAAWASSARTTIAILNKSKWERLFLPLPPLAEQQRIAEKVERLMALCDELEAAQTNREARRDRLWTTSLRNLVALDESKENARFFLRHSARMITSPEHVAGLREAIQDLAVGGWLVPQDPEDGSRTTMSLGEACQKITDGTHRTPTYVSSGTPFISVKDFSAGQLSFASTRYITPTEHSVLVRRCDPRRGDVLIGRIGTLGKAVVVDTDKEFSLFVSVGLLRPKRAIASPEYLKLYLNSSVAHAEYDRIKVGAGTHTNKLNLGDLKTIAVTLPPLKEQHRIVAKVDKLMAVCDELEQSLAAEQTKRGRLLEALLRDALEDALPARELELLGAR